MTNINLHGILKFEFGETIQMKIRKPKELVDAISCNKKRFRHRLHELSNEGLNFGFLVNGKKINNLTTEELERPPKQIDIVPIIIGQGPALIAVGAIALGASFFTGGIMIGAVSLSSILLGVGVGLVSMGIQAMLAPKAPKPEGVTGRIASIDQSFTFSSTANMATQGSPVPVGYGRLRTGSLVVQATIKSYPMNIRPKTHKKSIYARSDQDVNNKWDDEGTFVEINSNLDDDA